MHLADVGHEHLVWFEFITLNADFQVKPLVSGHWEKT